MRECLESARKDYMEIFGEIDVDMATKLGIIKDLAITLFINNNEGQGRKGDNNHTHSTLGDKKPFFKLDEIEHDRIEGAVSEVKPNRGA